MIEAFKTSDYTALFITWNARLYWKNVLFSNFI